MADESHGTLPGVVTGRAVDHRDDRTVLDLFEARAAEAPGAPAVSFGERTLSYGELDGRANALAALLTAHGIGHGDFVPLAMDGGLELPVGMIAAMKLAAPFVPVDHHGPRDRVERMLTALDAKVVVRSPGGPPLPGDAPEPVVDLSALEERPYGPATRRAGPDDLAYGFYTSGSTGFPKCALNLHRGLVNRFRYMSRRFDDGSGGVVLQNSPHYFDSSLWQLLWPLTAGDRVVIPERTGTLDLVATIDVIHRHQVTMTDFVPSIFNALVELVRARPGLLDRLVSLRRLLIGGEEMTPDAVHAFRSLLPRVSIVNTYGPTEASIGSVFHEVTDSDGDDIPIGLPIDNTYVVIVDEEMRPVGDGEVGEICIGGECLGLGYLKDPEKTKAVFVDNPFPEIPGDRLYRTGDRGHRRPDGLIGFVGRLDHQVKISGVRIELSEVEGALQRHPEVREAKVVVQDVHGVKLLVAFVTCRSEDTDTDSIREHAQATLPAAMVPRRFIIIPRMPLTANGKADRRTLARLAAEHAENASVEPEGDDVEAVVRAVWRDLLPVGATSESDDFFELGADSLIAQRLTAAFAERFGAVISVRDVFEHPTLGGQIALVKGEMSADGDGTSPADLALIESDSVLAPDVQAPAQVAATGLRDVLLTGATGFVGAQILHDLLAGTSATVHCLVRAEDGPAAYRRIVENLTYYRLWDERFAERTVAVPGDLGRPLLGLGQADFARLAEDVDTIIHNGAMVNLARGYRAHREVNVLGTVELLRLATAHRTKPVHFVSTIGVLPALTEGEGAILEQPVPAGTCPEDGYSRSKWVAERLLEHAAARGLPVTIYRLGEVLPHSRIGVPSHRGLPDLIVKACLHTGMWFRSPVAMDCTPVDTVGSLVVAGVRRGERGYFHIVQPGAVCLDELLLCFEKRFSLEEVSYPTFWETLRRATTDEPDQRDLVGVMALLPRPEGGADDAGTRAALTSLFWDDAKAVSRARTERLIADADLSWTPAGQDVFQQYARYYPSVGEVVGKQV